MYRGAHASSVVVAVGNESNLTWRLKQRSRGRSVGIKSLHPYKHGGYEEEVSIRGRGILCSQRKSIVVRALAKVSGALVRITKVEAEILREYREP